MLGDDRVILYTGAVDDTGDAAKHLRRKEVLAWVEARKFVMSLFLYQISWNL